MFGLVCSGLPPRRRPPLCRQAHFSSFKFLVRFCLAACFSVHRILLLFVIVLCKCVLCLFRFCDGRGNEKMKEKGREKSQKCIINTSRMSRTEYSNHWKPTLFSISSVMQTIVENIFLYTITNLISTTTITSTVWFIVAKKKERSKHIIVSPK